MSAADMSVLSNQTPPSQMILMRRSEDVYHVNEV